MFDHKLLGGVAVVAMACATAHAQQTTASLRGSITDTNGSGLSNASVVVLHEPTGTSSSVETSGNGTFSISNLRVGGPFTVTVTRDGYEAAVLENIFFVPGQQDPLRVELFSSDEDVVVVRAERNGVIGIDNGVGSSFSADQLQSQPSFGRDFSDILARDPLVNSNGNGNLNIAGINSNLNSLTVNGVAVQEEFGINSSGIFATQRPPIDLNAIESVSVSVADFSVLSSGFQGGLVNVVTKSGTNEFDGIVEYTWTDGDLAGDRAFDRDVDLGDFEEEELSISLGGPIIKDKLFFFVNYSDFERTSPGFPNFGDTDPALFGVLRDIAQDVYGFDPGDRFAINAGNQTTERFLGKLDWNINDDHRAALTYQKVEEFEIGSFGTFDFPTAARSEPLDNEAYTFELFSNWTENFSTTFRYATRESDFGRTPLGGVGGGLAGSTLPQIRVTVDQNDPFFAANGLDGTALVGTSPVRFDVGTAFFDQANAIEDELETIYLQGDYTLGDHTITAGFQREEYSVFNAFIPGSAGDVTFDTISDFENQFASEASLQLPASGIVADGVTNLDYELYSFFVQDSWSITPSFELTAGLRYSEDERRNDIQVNSVHYIFGIIGFPTVPVGFNSGDIEFDDDNISPEVSALFALNDNVNLFAAYKSGYKSGGIDNSALPSVNFFLWQPSGHQHPGFLLSHPFGSTFLTDMQMFFDVSRRRGLRTLQHQFFHFTNDIYAIHHDDPFDCLASINVRNLAIPRRMCDFTVPSGRSSVAAICGCDIP